MGLAEGDFVVCSFGMLGPTKLNHRLLAAWLATPMAKDKTCRLVFVGENHGGEYGASLLEAIHRSGCGERIKITGFAPAVQYRQYLAAADVAVQLRALSRGETSAAVLDCMNYGLPAVVNAHGSLAELRRTVWSCCPMNLPTNN
nr:glycosyltransferase [Desulforamulus profundi]